MLPTAQREAGKGGLTRSQVMARIRRRDTKPELIVRRVLHLRGHRFRVDHPLPGAGRVDIAFTRWRVAIQIDGCFWHGCPVHLTRPKSNQGFWDAKLESNRKRDLRQAEILKNSGWQLLRFWEHEIEDDLDAVICRIESLLGPRGGEATISLPV